MKNGTHITAERASAFMLAIESLAGYRVAVGFPAGATKARTAEPGEPADITNAQLAYIHDMGAPEANIPARPFMAPGIASVQPVIEEWLLAAGKAATGERADKHKVIAALNGAGMAAVSGIKRKLTTGPFTPLAAATLRARLAKGFVGTSPLIESSQMRNAVTYVLRSTKDNP